MPDGVYYYRVRAVADTDWSEVTVVEVKHHPLSRAFGFFSLGAFMFIIMLLVLFRGNSKVDP